MTLKPLILLPFLATPVFAGSMTAPLARTGTDRSGDPGARTARR